MSISLLDVAKSALGSGALSKLAGSLGESEEKTKSAFDIASSAILGGLIKKMSNPQGAKDVFEEVSRFDTSALDGITDVLGGGGSKEDTSALTSLGLKLLGSLFGSKQDSLIGMLAKMAGIDQGSSKSLLSMIAPLLLGTIAKQVKSGGLNLSGLTDLIMGQKSQVAKNLPSDFSRELGIANLLDEGSQAVRAGVQRTEHAATQAAESGAGLLKVLVPVAIIAVVGLLAWKMLSTNTAQKVAEGTIELGESAVLATEEAVEDAVDRVTLNKPAIPDVDFDAISSDLTSAFGDVTKSVSGITDEASARLALPEIEGLTKTIGQYGLDQMPEGASDILQGILQPLIAKLQAAIETASNIPGVKAILEPAIGGLMKSVSAFTQS